MAQSAVRYFGMFGEDVSYISRDKNNTSDEHNADVDREVQIILDQSFERVSTEEVMLDFDAKDLPVGIVCSSNTVEREVARLRAEVCE